MQQTCTLRNHHYMWWSLRRSYDKAVTSALFALGQESLKIPEEIKLKPAVLGTGAVSFIDITGILPPEFSLNMAAITRVDE